MKDSKNKKLILIVEDEVQYAFLLKKKLQRAGFNVDIAEDGELALESIKKEIPDLIVLDIIMPRMDGQGFLKNIKASKEFKDIEVLVLSNLGDESREELIKLGVKDFIIKTNISLKDMVSKIEEICN